ncbi:MAG TPA: DUF3108 domain-containing protein [Turneriella sp.]|nr:DUF3108 domain-containing protein [Turneriella sp.]
MRKIFIVSILLLFSAQHFAAPKKTKAAEKGVPLKFYNETMNFRIIWKGIAAGDVTLRSRIDDDQFININSRVNSLQSVRGIYYVQGVFASKWNFVTRSPVIAFEEAYQGDSYQRRKFRFIGNEAQVEKHEKKFHEHSYPHSEPPKGDWSDKYSVSTKGGYQDLLGAFYYVRSTGRVPRVGEVMRVPVLPAGSRRSLILKVLGREKRKDVPFFGTREIIHVRSALADDAKNKTGKGSNIFFNTKSQIDMWITADEDFVPVKLWTEVPYLGTAYILLENYSQP